MIQSWLLYKPNEKLIRVRLRFQSVFKMENPYKILMIEAHPDDETVTFFFFGNYKECVGLLYKISHRLKGIIDLAVVIHSVQ